MSKFFRGLFPRPGYVAPCSVASCVRTWPRKNMLPTAFIPGSVAPCSVASCVRTWPRKKCCLQLSFIRLTFSSLQEKTIWFLCFQLSLVYFSSMLFMFFFFFLWKTFELGGTFDEYNPCYKNFNMCLFLVKISFSVSSHLCCSFL